jgi:hypothetical protein
MTGVEAVLRAERLAIGVAGVVLYLVLGGSWLLLVPLLLAIDLSMIGYLAGPRVGAITYNAAHNFVIALLTVGAGWWFGSRGSSCSAPSGLPTWERTAPSATG